MAATPVTLGRRSVLLLTAAKRTKSRVGTPFFATVPVWGERPAYKSAVFAEKYLRRVDGTRLATPPAMVLRRAHSAAIAAASDGSVLINVVDLLPATVRERLSKALGVGSVFVGIPLNEREAEEVVGRLDGAAAEASAHVLGSRGRKASKAPSKKRR